MRTPFIYKISISQRFKIVNILFSNLLSIYNKCYLILYELYKYGSYSSKQLPYFGYFLF